MPIDALSVLCAQLTRDRLAIAKFLLTADTVCLINRARNRKTHICIDLFPVLSLFVPFPSQLCFWPTAVFIRISYLAESILRTSNVDTRRRLRSANTAMLVVPSTRRSTLGDCAFPWLRHVPSSVRNAPSLTTFRRELKTVLLRSSFDDD